MSHVSLTSLDPVENIRCQLEDVDAFDDALDLLAEVTMDLGFTHVLYGYIPVSPRLPNGNWLPLKLNLRNFPEGFEAGWQKFMQIDPYYRACFDTTLPIEWKSVQSRDSLLNGQREALSYLSDFGLNNGITVPVHLPFGKFAVMSAITKCPDREWAALRRSVEMRVFHLMHSFTRGLHERQLESQIPTVGLVVLTQREKECLKWASAGKTSAETATIIGRSVETVRLHIKNCIVKLDATNRAQAVATALHYGLL